MYDEIVEAVLQKIEDEMCRLYWNANQKELSSPFRNTGESYGNGTFVVRAYYWGDDEVEIHKPNFEYKGFKVYWYKYLGRGLSWECDEELTLAYLDTMMNDCIKSLQHDFKEEDE